MSLLCDAIEGYLLRMMASDGDEIQVRRGELAQMFHCAPSQINYVLSTRFTPAHGFLIESQRGGGGYIRILRVPQDNADAALSEAMEHCLAPIPEAESRAMLNQLTRCGFLTERETAMMSCILSENHLKKISPDADSLRSDLLIRMLAAIRIQNKKENDHGTV